ncbi:hypothetical protein ABPG72_011586 [Tetrahymena utriculariae]
MNPIILSFTPKDHVFQKEYPNQTFAELRLKTDLRFWLYQSKSAIAQKDFTKLKSLFFTPSLVFCEQYCEGFAGVREAFLEQLKDVNLDSQSDQLRAENILSQVYFFIWEQIKMVNGIQDPVT